MQILFFGKARELLGLSSSELTLPRTLSQGALFSAVQIKFPELKSLTGCFVLALDQDYLEPESSELVRLQNGSELAVIPPISGG